MTLPVNTLIQDVRFDIEEVSPGIWSNEALLGWLNEAITKVATALRAVREDHLVTRMTSSDAATTINGQTYNPSSLQIVSGTTEYTLPPDLVEIRVLEPLDDADKDDGIRFIARDIASPDYRDLARTTDTSDLDTAFFFDLTGLQTLRIAPEPARTINTELLYIRYRQNYTISDTVDLLPDYARAALRMYTKYRALNSIQHPDTQGARIDFFDEMNTVQSLGRPRQSKNIVLVDDFFADDGIDGISQGFDPFD